MKTAILLSVGFFLVASHTLAQQPAPESTAAVVRSSANATSEGEDAANPTDQIEQAQKTYESALALYNSGKSEEAFAALKEAEKLRPDDAEFQYLVGMAYSQGKAYKEAAESFRRAARFKPDWPEAHFRLGMMSYVLGRRSQSTESYKKLLGLNSPLANTLYKIIKEVNDPFSVAEMSNLSDASYKSSAEPRPAATPVPNSLVKTAPEVLTPSTNTEPAESATSTEASLTSIYRVGVGDILDIRLLNLNVSGSSLYTVIDSGMIDLPIAGGAIQVAGLTTEEIQARVAGELKRRAVAAEPQVSVGVRQYSSHTIIITGLVGVSGRKVLRREAVPLYVVIAEAQPRLDAGRAVIMRPGVAARVIDLSDSASLNTVIKPGDVINVTARPQEFYYIAGRVNQPGQKSFQSGITLLQAILAAGGVIRPGDNTIELSREAVDGLLHTTKFSLKEIKNGKIQDPKLQPGDRIEVVNN